MSRALVLAILLAACDGGIHERGIVTDAKTRQPIANAQVWFADRAMDQGLGSYLDNKITNPGPPNATTDDHGAFTVSERLAGPSTHDVWIVVRAPGHTEVRRQVWKGEGFKSSEKPLEIALEPAP